MHNTQRPDSEHPLSISQLNRLARNALEQSLGTLWLIGEISNFTRAASGHWYFTLKDDKAQVKAAMFRNSNRVIAHPPREGDQVVVRANVGLYEPRGDYQLVVEKMIAEGEGRLKRAFEQLKQQLMAEGLFDSQHKQPLPDNIRRIGVITSASGAALHDVLSVLKRRNPATEVILYPAMVQGEQAHLQLVNAIATANRRQEVDVLLLTRGGGSLEDLWCFNHVALARAIAASDLPIVSAVGHEVDITIADFVADLRAPTPSAAAELLSKDRHSLLQQQQALQRRLLQQYQIQYKRAQHQWHLLSQQLTHAHPARRLQAAQQTLDFLQVSLQQRMRYLLEQSRQRLGRSGQLLHSVSPLATLARGYSITLHQQQALTEATTVKPGDELTTRLQSGSVISIVSAVHPKAKI